MGGICIGIDGYEYFITTAWVGDEVSCVLVAHRRDCLFLSGYKYGCVGRTDYVLLSMSKEKKDNTVSESEDKLLRDTMAVYEKSLLNRRDADFNFRLICEWLVKHKDDSPESLGEEGMLKAKKEADTLMGRLRISVEALKQLDAEYESMRQRVNTYYKKEILPPHPPSPTWEEMLKEADDDEGEEWKRG